MVIVYIYGLKDPRTNAIRYIGQTVNLETRLNTHINRCIYENNKHKARWIRQLINLELKPIIIVLDVVSDIYADIAEKIWIRFGKCQNWPLVNIAEGGQGGALFAGHKHSEESRNKIRIGHVGVPMSENARKKLSEANRKRVITEETRLKRSQNAIKQMNKLGNPMQNRHHTDFAKTKISDSLKEYFRKQKTND